MVSFFLLLASVAAVAPHPGGFQERADPRERTIVEPVRVMWTTPSNATAWVESPERLTGRHFGQMPEPDGVCTLWNKGVPSGVLIDFGRELHGGVQIVTGWIGPRKVRIRFGESAAEAMAELGERNAGNDHAIRDDVVTLPGMGMREFGMTGFRFVRIDALEDGPTLIGSVRAVSLMRPMKRLGGFRCSDERLNRVFETAVRTVHLCCQEHLWDGIKRDRLVWMGDTHPETSVILAVFGKAPVLPETFDFAIALHRPDQWMNGMSPYTMWFLRNVHDWWWATGDVAYLRRHAAYLKATCENLAKYVSPSNTPSDRLKAPFLDWPSNHNMPAVRAGMQALMLQAFLDSSEMAAAVGDRGWQALCDGAAAKLATVRPDPHGSKQAAAMLALSGLRAPKEMHDEVLGRDGLKGVSTFYGYYMLEAMSAAGENGRALATVRDYWGAMLDMGATSFWEDFNVAWTNNAFRIDELPVKGRKDVHGDYGEFCYRGFRHSLCHGWSAGPAAWLIRHVLGIRPTAVGCKAVAVRPFLGDLDWAEGSMALPDGGAVSVRVTKRTDGSLDVQVSAPPGVRVECKK